MPVLRLGHLLFSLSFPILAFLLLSALVFRLEPDPQAIPNPPDPRSNLTRRASISDTISANAASGDFTCGPDRECVNGACCGKDGWCGYGSKYCGDGCQSNCDATAECGELAKEKGKTCPLNVCCSEFGFCGTTSEFCSDGCQSNCETPDPSGGPSDSQKRIIGYWEAWNVKQKPCGTMDIGEIPVHLLTHLIVAFGFISPDDFKVTNMDGVDTEVYRDAGNVKLRNPDIKIMIALGGWTFSDPGPWQSVFPDLTSTKEKRGTFIKNLLGFLKEYGYDGVDFDWEYPGADDRGGSDKDAANYVALVKELREAIDASGHDYLVTYTAPTSYWYLRHFDVPGMSKYVNWINLMSYDLHGVWDSSNPIGNQVLAHTNLTEIDQALDLFWRVKIDPADIVLGLGFYGRSFALEDASCWKPGCSFSGPGKAGPCSETAGILSYREIQDILSDTGATAYLDKEAGARYMVYAENNWISFDDETTFKEKIDYANKIGLSGLMVWAVDLDDSQLSALSTIAGTKRRGGDVPFNLVDLKNIFPKDMLPPDDVKPQYGLVTFDAGSVDPSNSPFALAVSGESHAVTSLNKRNAGSEPFTFIDCPFEEGAQNEGGTSTARVVCMNDDVEGCFRLLERGVEGTIVAMPDNCAPGSIARAISLETSQDQSIPFHLSERSPTSEVLDFTFDFNISLARRDAKSTSIRFDYSNVGGYWDEIVDSPGIQSDKEKRFFGEDYIDWRDKYAWKHKYNGDWGIDVEQDISQPLYWETAEDCPSGDYTYEEGIAAYVTGNFQATLWYGFSMVASVTDDGLDVVEANGFLKVNGGSDITYGLGGLGSIDISKISENPIYWTDDKRQKLMGHSVDSFAGGEVHFQPWFSVGYMLATFEDVDDVVIDNTTAVFNGRQEVRVQDDFGDFMTTFPDPNGDQQGSGKKHRNRNKIELSDDNIIYSSYGAGSTIVLGTSIDFGLDLTYNGPEDKFSTKLPNIMLWHETLTTFKNSPGEGDEEGGVCSDVRVTTSISQSADDLDAVDWGGETIVALDRDDQYPSSGQMCYPDVESSSNEARSLFPSPRRDLIKLDDRKDLIPRGEKERYGWGYLPKTALTPYLLLGDVVGDIYDREPVMDCDYTGCTTCTTGPPSTEKCCGCTSMMYIYRFSDMPRCDTCEPDDHKWPGFSSDEAGLDRRLAEAMSLDDDDDDHLNKRVPGVITKSPKVVTACEEPYYADGPYLYPAFPSDPTHPWEGVENGEYDSISRYWGNKSADCDDWSTAKLSRADQEYIAPGVSVRAHYQTEHVFEGQVIGDFFTEWLDKGKISNQSPPAKSPKQIESCTWTQKYFINTREWTVNGKQSNFFEVLLSELGNIAHKNRLAIYRARPNQMKGRLFRGWKPIADATFGAMNAQEQLLAVKELGSVFTYLNSDDIWGMYCGVYEAIYDRLGEFDRWYKNKKHGDVDMQSEWKKYNRVVLDSLVSRTKADFEFYYMQRRARSPLQRPHYAQWEKNNQENRKLFKFSKVCKNMDP